VDAVFPFDASAGRRGTGGADHPARTVRIDAAIPAVAEALREVERHGVDRVTVGLLLALRLTGEELTDGVADLQVVALALEVDRVAAAARREDD